MRIGLRILLGYFVIVALAALLLGQVFLREVKPGVRQAMEDTLVDTANVLAELATDDFLAGRINEGAFARRVRALAGRDIGAGIWGFEKRESSYRITIADARGIVVFDSAGRELGADHSRWNDVHLTLRGRYGARSTRSDPGDDASSVMYVAAPIRDDGGRIVGALTVSKPNRAMAPFIARSEGVILRWGLVLLGTALLVGLSAAWWLSRQLGALRRYADAVTAGERALPPDAAGEFGDLGRALETMRERLEDRRYVERYVHTLTHELKSPLAAIRGSTELLESSLPGARLAFGSRLDLELRGTESFAMLPLARDNDLRLRSRWRHPRFEGLSPVHDLGQAGFDARWKLASLATEAQARYRHHASLAHVTGTGDPDAAGVTLVDPVNAYLQAERATKYGLLFVLLTFIAFFMFELIRQQPIHPIQYALVGLALAVFFLLLVSLGEHIAFGLAYLVAAVACIGLVGFYLSAVLGGAARGAGFAAMLATLYAALYGLLVSEDNALVLGAGLLFVVLAAIMVVTRRIDWYRVGA